MSRPRLLDLFCGAGGCSVGYHRAGFDVVGVDIKPQPNYPFEFVQADALDPSVFCDEFAAIHASPPCQAYSVARKLATHAKTPRPRLIVATREILQAVGLPYVIENVEGAATELRAPHLLCGSGFGLDVQRHRLFETNFWLMSPGCAHGRWQGGRFPGTPRADGSRPLSKIVNPMSRDCSHSDLANAMGIDWMPPRGFRPTEELREAIPPVYTEHIGGYLMAAVQAGVAA